MVRTIAAADPECVVEAVAVLRRGGLIVYPTDTVYGLGALATDDEAVWRLFRAKGRASDRALPLLLAEAGDAAAVAAEVPPLARTLMDRFWPGGLTIVLRKAPRFQSLALAGGDTVAVRVPDQTLVREVIRRAGGPLIGTSANRSGLASPLWAAEAVEQVGEEVDLVIDGGRCPGGVESTLIDITGNTAEIVREGALERAELEKALGVRVSVRGRIEVES